ncbi:peptide ABC transporter substrate-binding protein [Paracoccus sp. P2]|uniref:Peptide ABC transporter substrate-binding protein n=1 Tax=Paracoccus pantotrophus TaxID=82367 RepID=A0A1I5F4Q6_PARPN|nr:peptide ABC transporter substrate-binding protein [Paracoccus pantotrophus]MDF3853298.1 peptide ABC transporter substrate-binding protein [Paracoccus pantotrophus]QFG37017.1 peptide ABC transporter substrate-binding protein [Paracoccus pantotrophus]QLH14586.1 peptide ABC transporter substrate-binding protein [Paracoccus pantotrophus]RDD98538.1 peptide ABC transporter substrate-binding protein [Paracoccus pantotrophus]RKS52568.1 peptide/nickel transport system substrate-binding protein [Para
MKLRSLMPGAAATAALAAAMAPAAFAERGSDGQVNVIMWQAPSTMNPYLSAGTKDIIAGSVVLEPLASFTPEGEVVPRLAAEIPSVENGGISEDLKTVIWKLQPGIKWSDGTPFTADDVAFTAEYCMNPQGGCAQLAKFEGVEKVEAVDELTVRVTFVSPRPDPFSAFVGAQSPILQKAQFQNCLGEAAPTCTEQNFNPIGTGAFVVREFRTNDVISFAANPEYRDPAKPAFATLLMKGGGDAAAAARAVLETGEFDYAWNTQLSPDVIAGMEAAGKGKNAAAFGSLVERIHVNLTDPSSSLPEGERSTIKHPHPILTDPAVRKALSMAIDRQLLTEIGYGPAGQPTCNLVPAPAAWASENTECLTQDIEAAKALLDEAGWTVGAGGIREKDGKRLTLLFQTSVNAVRQDFQALIKQWWSEIGVETELKVVDPSVFFGGDAGSPDTFQKFYADVEMYANNFEGSNPEPYLARQTCDKAPGPENQWQGENTSRYCDPEYDRLIGEMTQIVDPAERGAMGRRLNEMLTRDSNAIIPLVYRGTTSAVSNALGGVKLNAWDSELWNVADWHRVK